MARIQNTNTQHNLPTLVKRLDRRSNREGLPEHFERDEDIQMWTPPVAAYQRADSAAALSGSCCGSA